MKLLSVNIAQPREVEYSGRRVSTGIFKQPVHGALMLHQEGLEGDAQADLSVHGGVDKAAYAYPIEHYAYWQQQLGREAFPHGQFGETLTIEGLLETDVAIGDRLRIGEALLEVSQPRTPCFKLGIKMGRKEFPKEFQDSGRVGFYMRVIEPGHLCAGDAIEVVSRYTPRHTVNELWRWSHLDKDDHSAALAATRLEPLAKSWKEKFAKRLGH